MTRDFFWPLLLAGAVGLPLLMSQSGGSPPTAPSGLNDPYANPSWKLANTVNSWGADGYTLAADSNSPGGYSTPKPLLAPGNSAAIPNHSVPGWAPPQSNPNTGGWGSLLNSPPTTLILPGTESAPDLSAVPLAFMPVTNFADVLRLDAQPNWVKSRWERISVFTSPEGWSGYRCDLITGVNPSDIHGCLTYFFDGREQLTKISFRGWTGDPANFITFAETTWGLKRERSGNVGLWSRQNWRRTTGLLISQDAAVLRADRPTERVALYLELLAPATSGELSSEMLQAAAAVRQ